MCNSRGENIFGDKKKLRGKYSFFWKKIEKKNWEQDFFFFGSQKIVFFWKKIKRNILEKIWKKFFRQDREIQQVFRTLGQI